MPVLRKQVEEDLTPRVRLYHFRIQGDPQTRSRWQRKITVDDLRITWRSRLHELFCEVVEVFLDLEVRGACGQVQVRGGGHRTAHIVRGDENIVGIRPGRKLLCFENSPEVGNV